MKSLYSQEITARNASTKFKPNSDSNDILDWVRKLTTKDKPVSNDELSAGLKFVRLNYPLTPDLDLTKDAQ